MQNLLPVLFIPLYLLNQLRGIVAGGWLIYLGDWQILGIALGSFLLSMFGLALFWMPSFIFSIPARFLLKKAGILKVLGYFLGCLAGAWTYLIMGVWTLSVFTFALDASEGQYSVPYLMLAYALANGPFSYAVPKKEPDFDTNLAVITNQLSSVTLLILLALTKISLVSILMIFVLVILIGSLTALGFGALRLTLKKSISNCDQT